MRIGVIGTGHVGLVTCATLSALGHEVVGNDSDREKIDTILSGRPWFHEPGLEELLARETEAGRLNFSYQIADATSDADVVFLCVGTPPKASGEASLVAVESAARDVARHAGRRVVVVEKSTVPAGTARRVKRALILERPSDPVDVCSNPEFLREGHAVQDSLEPDRILVGTDTEHAREVMRAVYQPLTAKGVRLIETDIATAELAKHACNAFLSMKISFINAIARLCERAGGDVLQVAEVMGSDPRIGREFLNAGLGYGGFCFPKDLAAFDALATELGYDFGLLREVAKINDEAIDVAAQQVKDAVWNIEGKRLAMWGLSFKPQTDDTRFSPALTLAKRLIDEGAEIVGYDPQAMSNAKADLPELELANDIYDAAAGAHCVIVATEWSDFLAVDLERLKSVMAYPVIVDTRNLFDPQLIADAGFWYYPVGRAPIT
ncbi:MAG TPA: UDP-glucose/GDP-mannose dehydrogenase family protein [Actinomycetota bacterium]|nr:UDP-glucose/GDP-mannose dehydrogenase family protein [Actinomycetota bacterium]